MKRASIIAILMIFCISSSAGAMGLRALFVNGLPVPLSSHVLSGGSYFVPIRPLAEALGFTVHWDERLRQVKLDGEDMQITVAANERVTINGEEHYLERGSFLRQGQLFVPLRSFAETLGGQVDYDGATEQIYVYMGATFARQVTVSSSHVSGSIERTSSGLEAALTNVSEQPVNALVLVSSQEGKLDFVSWIDAESSLPMAMLQPGTEYNTSLRFPDWVSSVDQVDVLWVDSARFRGVRPPSADCWLSIVVSFRPRDYIPQTNPMLQPDLTE